MTQTTSRRDRGRGRLFPEFTIAPEELARRKAERDERCQRSQGIFEQVRPQLIDDHYNWFMIIEPNRSKLKTRSNFTREGLREEGLPIPETKTRCDYVEVR